MSAPAPGKTPIMTPTVFPRSCCFGYSFVRAHWPARMLPRRRRSGGGGSAESIARMTSDTAKTPTRAGITSTPPRRLVLPNVKRGVPAGFSIPMHETSNPSSMLAIAFAGDERETMVAHMSPRKASQKYSNVEKRSAMLASGGASAINASVPKMPPSALNHRPMPSASSGLPLRVMA